MTFAYVYDLVGTLIKEIGRRDYFKLKDVEWCDAHYGEAIATEVYAKTVIEGIHNGSIVIVPLESATEMLQKNAAFGVLNIVYSSGTRDEIITVLKAAKLDSYIDSFISTFTLDGSKSKSKDNFLTLFKKLQSRGIEIKKYYDDSVQAIASAQKASLIIKKKFGTAISIVRVNNDNAIKNINKTE